MQSQLFIALEQWPAPSNAVESAATQGVSARNSESAHRSEENSDRNFDSKSLPCWVQTPKNGWVATQLEAVESTWKRDQTDKSDLDRSTVQEIEKNSEEKLETLTATVLLLSPSVVSSTLQVPKKQQRHLSTILPFLCEEKVATDIEEVHLCTGSIDHDKVPIRLIEKRQLTQLIDLLDNHNIQANRIVCATDLFETDCANVWLDKQRMIFCTETEAIVTAASNASTLLNRWYMDQDQKIQSSNQAGEKSNSATEVGKHDRQLSSLMVSCPESALSSELQLTLDSWKSQGASIELQPISEHADRLVVLDKLLENENETMDRAANQGINLLTGDFKPKAATRKSNTWSPLIKVASLFLAINIVYLLGSGFYWQYKTEQTQKDTETLYREYFPNDRRIVNIKRQTENHLRRADFQGDSGLITRLNRFVHAWGQQTQLTLRSLRYHQQRDELILDVEAQSIGQLDALQQSLGKQAELLAANEEGANRARGRLKLKGVQ